MKRILIMLGVLGMIHCSASAQVGTYNPADRNTDPPPTGQKMTVILGKNQNNNSTSTTHQYTTRHATNATTGNRSTAYSRHTNTHKTTRTIHHAIAVHHTTHHTVAYHATRPTMRHTAVAHRTVHHKTTHVVATHRTSTHRSYASNNSKNQYAGYKHTTNQHNPINTSDLNTNRVNSRSDYNNDGQLDLSKIPGTSNGGWDNGTNGRGGTEINDGTFHPGP